MLLVREFKEALILCPDSIAQRLSPGVLCHCSRFRKVSVNFLGKWLSNLVELTWIRVNLFRITECVKFFSNCLLLLDCFVVVVSWENTLIFIMFIITIVACIIFITIIIYLFAKWMTFYWGTYWQPGSLVALPCLNAMNWSKTISRQKQDRLINNRFEIYRNQ